MKTSVLFVVFTLPHPRDVIIGGADDEARVLERLPLALCMKLDDPSLVRGRRIGNLAYGVVPVEPDLVRFDVNVRKVNKPWYEAACK